MSLLRTTFTAHPENAGLFFVGEARWPEAVITTRLAEAMLARANRAGRTNDDVLRRHTGLHRGRWHTRWQIDFPPHTNAQEAALYERPHDLLRRRTGGRNPGWWLNPHAQPVLRTALARLERYLVLPLASDEPAWAWIESEILPDASLLVFARDDDFTAAVLHSASFSRWWQARGSRADPVASAASFRFPWPPATPLGSLTREQQEARSRVIRAHLAGDATTRDETVEHLLNS